MFFFGFVIGNSPLFMVKSEIVVLNVVSCFFSFFFVYFFFVGDIFYNE